MVVRASVLMLWSLYLSKSQAASVFFFSSPQVFIVLAAGEACKDGERGGKVVGECSK